MLSSRVTVFASASMIMQLTTDDIEGERGGGVDMSTCRYLCVSRMSSIHTRECKNTMMHYCSRIYSDSSSSANRYALISTPFKTLDPLVLIA